MAYTADINIVVKGQAAVNSLQKSLIEVGNKLDELAKKRVGPSATLETFNKQLQEARSRLNEVVAGTSKETAAIKNYVTALGNANAAAARQNRLINDEIQAREAATGQLQKLIERQEAFTARTDAAAQAAHRQTAEFIRQQRIAKELAKIKADAPAPQLLLSPAAPGAPAMGGGARSRITGPVERLGGARTQDQADMALRFAQALKQQVRPLSQIKAIYAGIASEAAAMQRTKALPDAAMLNAAARGIKSLETSQDRYNRELAESAERLRQVDRLEASRARRAEKLRQRAAYESGKGTMGNAGFGVQGPAVPPGGVRKRGGVRSSSGGGVNRLESIALGVGFPLLFGGGAGEVLGSLAGSFAGKGFGGQILGGALGGVLDDFITKAGELGAALNPATANIETLVDALGGSTTAAGAYVAKLEELGRSQEALSAATVELERLVGKDGISALKEFGDDSTKLGELFSQAMTQMQAGVAALINSSLVLKSILAGLEYNVLLRQGLGSQDPGQQQLTQQREVAGRGTLFGGDPAKYKQLSDQIVENQRKLNAEKALTLEADTKALTAAEKQQKLLKKTKEIASELKKQYTDILNEAKKRVQLEQAAVDRGLAISSARYNAEKALNDLEGQRLERAYEFAKTARERYNIALALFNNQVTQAKLEYQQQLESIAAEERKLELAVEGIRQAEARIKLKAAEARLDAIAMGGEEGEARLKLINEAAAEALKLAGEERAELTKKLEAQKIISKYEKETARYQLESKILAAQSRLEQKLVSEEIGLSRDAARQLSDRLGGAAIQTTNVENAGQRVVGVIETATNRTVILAGEMSNVAAQAQNAAINIGNAIEAQARLNEMRSGGGGGGGSTTAYASGGYVTGPTRGLVGEAGPEYIIPAEKMGEAMSRYASGQRGSSVIPPSINPQVNVTTGPVMNMNGSNYVSQQDFMAGMQSASRRGAEMALQALQSNNNVRRSAGIG